MVVLFFKWCTTLILNDIFNNETKKFSDTIIWAWKLEIHESKTYQMNERETSFLWPIHVITFSANNF